MKIALTLAVAGLCALALAEPVHRQANDNDFLLLYKYIYQQSPYVPVPKDNFVESHKDCYTDAHSVEHFLEHWHYGMLPKGEIFSVFNDEHLEQAKALFWVLYYAKDKQFCFYNTAAWARQVVNEGMFVYSYSVALVHRKDTRDIHLPPIWEVLPHHFYNNEVIQQAHEYKQVYGSGHYPDHTYIVANHTDHDYNLHWEQQLLSYYLEDVGINGFYYWYSIYYPTWLPHKHLGWQNENRGDFFYHIHMFLLVRYYLERLSSAAGEVDIINWDVPINTPYYSALVYENGVQFPDRSKFVDLHEFFTNYGQRITSKYAYSYSFVTDYERRIRDAVDQGFVYDTEGNKVDLYTKKGINVLGNIIEANADSPNNRFYGPVLTFARHLLGYSTVPIEDYKVVPSALEHYETSLRDPIFYKLCKKLLINFIKYKHYLPSYTKDTLAWSGVKVQKVEFDELVTYFDWWYTNITNAVYYTEKELKEGYSIPVLVKQKRLEHKPFNYKVTVKSAVSEKAIVKVFLGPKYDEYGRYINFTKNSFNFVIFDVFVHDLKNGENVITRSSTQNGLYSDKPTFDQIYDHVLHGKEDDQIYHKCFFFPKKYMLPKGDYHGVSYQFFVYVYPFKGEKHIDIPCPLEKDGWVDNYPISYPMDRIVKYDKLFHEIPNMYFYETKIHHKSIQDINASV